MINVDCKGSLEYDLQKAFIAKIENRLQENAAWVDPHLWQDMRIERKQQLLINLAKHFDYEGSLARVNLYNYQSGERVGTYTPWSGVKVLLSLFCCDFWRPRM